MEANSDHLTFIVLVFLAIVLLTAAVMSPSTTRNKKASRNLQRRLRSVAKEGEISSHSLLREKYMRKLSPLEQKLENLPGMGSLATVIDQAGKHMLAHRLVLAGFFFALSTLGLTAWLGLGTRWVSFASLLTLVAPFVWIHYLRNRRIARFEAQLPEALDIMARALQAGHPFLESFKLIGEEMQDPVAREFGQVFNDINYGIPAKTALVSLLERVPSVSLNTLVTAMVIQQESGGRMAEILDNIAEVIRSRLRLERKVKSLSAEGRMSAWVLILLPFGLGLMMYLSDPDYITTLLDHPVGKDLITWAAMLMAVGIVWIKKVITIKV